MSRPIIPLLLLLFPALVSAQEKVTWQDHIRPIFENRCNNCHNADKKKGDLDLTTFAGIMAGGSGGASVEAGDAAASTLHKVVTHSAEPFMPPKGDKISQAEADLIAKWIAGGLLDSPNSTAVVKKKSSFAMKATASTERPEGPPPMPEHLLLEPVVTSARPNAVIALAHSPWAPLAALAAPRQVLLYHSVTGELLGVLPFPDHGTPETLSFSHNGALLLAGGGIPGKSGAVIVWDVKTGQPVINLSIAEEFDTILAADITADLSKVAVGGPGRKVRIYDTRTSQEIVAIKKHTDWVTSLAFSPDGVLLASGDRNGGLFVWEAGTGNEFYTLRAHEKMIAALAWRGDSNLLAAGSEDGQFTWWEMIEGKEVKKIGSHGGVLALGFAPDGRLVSGGRDGHVRIWDASGKQLRDWVPSDGSPVLETIFSDGGQRVLTGAWNGEVKSWDAGKEEAPPAVLISNPPSIETRLTTLAAEAPGRHTAAEQAAAVLTEKESAAAAAETELTVLRQKLDTLPEQEKTATALVDALQSEIIRLEQGMAGFEKDLAAAVAELDATPAPSPSPAPAAPGADAPPDVRAALQQATDIDDAVARLARTVAEKKVTALRNALTEGSAALTKQRAAMDLASQEREKLQAGLAAVQQKMPEQEKAAAEMKQQAETARAARDTAQAQVLALTHDTARWQAALKQKAALALRDEAKALKDKLEALTAEKTALEPAAAAAPEGPEATRLREIGTELLTLIPQAETTQKTADTAWQEYLDLLPKN